MIEMQLLHEDTADDDDEHVVQHSQHQHLQPRVVEVRGHTGRSKVIYTGQHSQHQHLQPRVVEVRGHTGRSKPASAPPATCSRGQLGHTGRSTVIYAGQSATLDAESGVVEVRRRVNDSPHCKL